MLTLRNTFLAILSLLTPPPAPPAVETRSAKSRDSPATQITTHEATQIEDERAFLASIRHLPDAARQEKLARREWYRQMAQRQDIIEAEQQANAYWHDKS